MAATALGTGSVSLPEAVSSCSGVATEERLTPVRSDAAYDQRMAATPKARPGVAWIDELTRIDTGVYAAIAAGGGRSAQSP
jgi:hypothetical protein